jgi:hypothetical protein
MTHSCLEGDFRYPRSIDKRSMNDIDCLIMSSTVLVDRVVEKNLTSEIKEQYSNQILPLLDKLNEFMNSSPNAKVLMPVQPTFILELVDLLLHKLNDRVRIVVISKSANSVVKYANINLDYLN